jgi:hypothetical protein
MFYATDGPILQNTNVITFIHHTAYVTLTVLLPRHDVLSSMKASVVYFRIRLYENGKKL